MPSSIDKIRPNDPRVKRQYAELNGHRWHYLDAAPKGEPKGTVVLIHGFPDLSLGWRYQIPMLLDLGFRCIALDCMGYGETGTSTNLAAFTFRAHADAIASLARRLGLARIVLGGHDWGGLTVYRVAQWHPRLVSHVFSVCTAYMAPTTAYVSVERLAATTVPQFGYQLQLGSEDGRVEAAVGEGDNADEATMRRFLLGMFGGRPASGRKFMSVTGGIDLKMLTEGEEFGMTPLMDKEELDYYVKEYMKNGIRGPCNWYRTRELNWRHDNELRPHDRFRIRQPTLFIQALRDDVLTPELSRNIERDIPNLTRGEVPAMHWALWQTPEKTNAIIKDWFEGVVLGGKSKL